MAAAKAGVALAGCGAWGRNLARNLHQMGHLVSVCDTDAEALRWARSACPGVATARRFARALEEPRVDAVAIASPSDQHFAMAREALLAGKDVFVEKPLALGVADAEELVHLARRKKRILMVGHILEYHPAMRRLRELVARGDLGRIYYVYSNRLNLGKVRKEENILWSFAPHDVSAILLLLGELPLWVSTSGEGYLQRRIADVTMTCLAFPSGARAHIFVSWLHPYKEQKLVVIGSRQMAVFDDVAREGKVRIFDRGIEWENGLPVPRRTAESTLYFPEIEPLREELAHFVDCVRRRRRPRTDGRSGLAVLRVLTACQRSIEAGGKPILMDGTS